MNPILLEVGNFSLHWYGLLIVGGATLSAFSSTLWAKRSGGDPDHIWNLLAWCLIAGILGARVYHVLSSPADGGGWSHYRENPMDIINFWSGGFRGLGIYGGLIGGVLAVIVYAWISKINVLQYLDYIAVNVPLAQAVGRFGNFVNQELYGPATDLPWAFHINPDYPCQVPEGALGVCSDPNITQQAIDWYATNGFHPTFFYEMLWNLMAVLVINLLFLRFGQRLRFGDGVLMLFFFYPVGRFLVEFLRPDAWMIGSSLAAAQWFALISVVVTVAAFLYRHVDWPGYPEAKDSWVGMSNPKAVAASS